MRLFVALVPPEGLRRSLERLGRELYGHCGGGRMVPWQNIHLTLAFLGECDRPRAAELAMGRSAGAPFSLRTGRPGRFPGRRGDLWWMGVEESPPLWALRRRLVRALGEEGLWLDDTKPFRPHLTLGRDLPAGCAPGVEAWAGSCPAYPWHVGEMTLMESRREAGGPRYIPLFRRPLRK